LNWCLASIESVRPGLRVLELSSRTGEGMEALMEMLAAGRAAAGRREKGVEAAYAS